MKTISVTELNEKLQNGDDIQLIDVREQFEYDNANLNGELIPSGEILDHVDKITKDKPVVIYCRSGNRSANVIKLLEGQFGYENLYNLEGGIVAWADKVDPDMKV